MSAQRYIDTLHDNPLDLSGLKILLVEDEFFIGIELKSAFEDLGAEVIGPVATVEGAVRAAQSGNISVAVLDLLLHGRISEPVANVLSERKIPFVVHSGNAELSMLGTHLNSAPLLIKPCPHRDIAFAIWELSR